MSLMTRLQLLSSIHLTMVEYCILLQQEKSQFYAKRTWQSKCTNKEPIHSSISDWEDEYSARVRAHNLPSARVLPCGWEARSPVLSNKNWVILYRRDNQQNIKIFPNIKETSMKNQQWKQTRFGPIRVMADMGEMKNLIFLWSMRIFGEILEDFWRIVEDLWRNRFIVRRIKNLHQ